MNVDVQLILKVLGTLLAHVWSIHMLTTYPQLTHIALVYLLGYTLQIVEWIVSYILMWELYWLILYVVMM